MQFLQLVLEMRQGSLQAALLVRPHRAPKHKGARDPDRAERVQSVRVLHHGQLGDLGHDAVDVRGVLRLARVRHVGDDPLDAAGQRAVGAVGDQKIGGEAVGFVRTPRFEVFLVSDVVQKAGQDDEIAVVASVGVDGTFGRLDFSCPEEDALDVLVIVRGVIMGHVFFHVGFSPGDEIFHN